MREQVILRIARHFWMHCKKRRQLGIVARNIVLIRKQGRIVRNHGGQGRALPQEPNELRLRLRHIVVVGSRGGD